MHLPDSAEVNLQLPANISEWQDRVKLSTCQACWTVLTLSNLMINSDISEKHHMLLFMALAVEKDYIHLCCLKQINIKVLYWFINHTQITGNQWTTGWGVVSAIQIDPYYESEMLINMPYYLNMLFWLMLNGSSTYVHTSTHPYTSQGSSQTHCSSHPLLASHVTSCSPWEDAGAIFSPHSPSLCSSEVESLTKNWSGSNIVYALPGQVP